MKKCNEKKNDNDKTKKKTIKIYWINTMMKLKIKRLFNNSKSLRMTWHKFNGTNN